MTSRRTEVETLDALVDSTEREAPAKRPTFARASSQLRDPSEGEDGSTRPRAFVGDMLAGKYRLVRPLGEGGMGSVWVAAYEALDIRVAVKIIRADAKGTTAKKLSQRMQQEVRAAAKIGHPAIVRTTDVGETPAGDAFCVMELLEGEDIAAFLAGRGRLNAAKAVQALLPIAHALSLAHDQGIVHRDLKPENIFLAKTADGTIQPKLIDFGIAKIGIPEGGHRITQDGALLGSPAYMSPEQGRGKDVDHRGDVWAFSVVLYEMVSHRMPFEGDNYHALVRSIVEDKPVPLTNFAVGDATLWAIVERGLAKDPAERWQSMRDLGSALARWLLAAGIREDICNSSLERTWLRGGGLDLKGPATPGDPFSRLSMAEAHSTIAPPPSEQPVSVEPRSGTPMSNVTIVPPTPAPRRRSMRASIAVVGIVACVVAAGYFLVGRGSNPTASPPPASAEGQQTPSAGPEHATSPASSSSVPSAPAASVATTPASGEPAASTSPSAAKSALAASSARFPAQPLKPGAPAKPPPAAPPPPAEDLGLRRPKF